MGGGGESPLISIITASYNYEKYIAQTIESIENQTYDNWELIIVDDGSKDNSVNIIKEYCARNPKIKLLQHENGINKGLAETIQLGIKNAKSDWIAFLEADDTVTSDYLEKKINVIKSYPEVNFIFNQVNIVSDSEKTKKDYEDNYIAQQEEFIKKLKFPCKLIKILQNKYAANYLPTFSCIMLKKELFESIDYDSPVKPYLDFYIYLQIAKRANCYYIEERLTNWLRHEESYITNKVNNKNLLLFQLEQLKYLDYYIFVIPNILKTLRRLLFRFSLKRRILTLFGKEYKF